MAVLPCIAHTCYQHRHVVDPWRGLNSALDPGAVVPHVAAIRLIGGRIQGIAHTTTGNKPYCFNVKWIRGQFGSSECNDGPGLGCQRTDEVDLYGTGKISVGMKKGLLSWILN